MNIVSTQFDLAHNAMEIYFSGCNFHCKNCQNQELWDFNQGTPWRQFVYDNKLWQKIKDSGPLIKQVVLLGGEPLHQDQQDLVVFMEEMEQELPEHFKILFTGFELRDIPFNIMLYFDLIKCGQYKEELKEPHEEEGYELATSNQYFAQVCEARTGSQAMRRCKFYFGEK